MSLSLTISKNVFQMYFKCIVVVDLKVYNIQRNAPFLKLKFYQVFVVTEAGEMANM